MKNKKPILIAKNLVKTYVSGSVETKVLRGINLEIEEGSFVSITGRSGSGKSTLLYVLSLLDVPTSGEIFFEGCDIKKFSERMNSFCRLKHFGFVFQDYALLPELTALENTMIPLMVSENNWTKIEETSKEMLSRVGLGDKLKNYPSQLSGGEKQRVAIARAISNNPRILFADEPTANLDSKRADEIIDLISDLHKKGLTVVLVTHEKKYLQKTDRIIELMDGTIKDSL